MQVQELLNTDLYAAAVQAIRDHIVGKHTSDQASGEVIQLELIITSSYLSHSIYQRYNKGTWSKTKHSIPPTYSGAKKKENHIIELAILTEKKKRKHTILVTFNTQNNASNKDKYVISHKCPVGKNRYNGRAYFKSIKHKK